MIKYSFSCSYDAILEKNVPTYSIDDSVFHMLAYMQSQEKWYIDEILENLKELKNWKIEKYDFWDWEVSTIRSTFVDWKLKSVIHYDDYDSNKNKYVVKKLSIPFEDIFNLIKDWKEYIEKWEKETGKKMP